MKTFPELYNHKAVKRFNDNIVKTENGCIEWTSYKDKDGYGRMTVCTGGSNQEIKSHRYALGLHLGKIISPEINVCHKCDNRACVNPDHLFEGSQSDNIQDMIAKGRKATIKSIEVKNAKLTENDVLNIRNNNLSINEIHEQYNMSKTRAWKVKNGKTYKDVK